MPDLTQDQAHRLTAVAAVLADVGPPLPAWLEDLSRDADPEREVQTWERYAKVFRLFSSPSDPLKHKRELLRVCLSYTPSLPSLVKDERYETMSDDEVEQVCRVLSETA